MWKFLFFFGGGGFLSALLAKWLVSRNYLYSDFMNTRGYFFSSFHRCEPSGKEKEQSHHSFGLDRTMKLIDGSHQSGFKVYLE